MSTNKIFIPYYISSNTGAPAQVLPRVFFYNGLKESDPYWIQHWTTSSFGKTVIAQQYSAFPYFDNYSGQVTTTSSLSLLFLNEDAAYGNEIPSQSLYDLYWSKYVDLLYNPRTRIIRLSAVLPFPVYQKLELNDIIQLRSNYYHLRAINDYNLKTGDCRMELLGPLLEGSLNNTFTFDNTCEQTPTLYGSVINDTGSRQITFAITGSNCCNNPNYVTVKAEFGTGSCPAAPTQTAYVTLPNSYPIVVDYASLLVGYPTVNCVTMSVANLCYGIPITGSYLTFFTGALSGSYGNYAISASAQKNDCSVCQTGSIYTTTVDAGTYTSTASQANANAQALAYLTSVSQSNANTFGSCSFYSYYNTAISASVQKNDCSGGTGSFSTITLAASYSFDSCSQANAQNVAQLYFNSISQSQANLSGSCLYNSLVNYSMQFYLGDASQSAQFPVTLSAMYQATTASVPSDNDPSWSVVGYLSSSQNNGTLTYVVGTQTIPTGSYIYTKMRGPAGIKYGSWIGIDTASAYFVSLSANYMQQPTRVANTGSTSVNLNGGNNGPLIMKKLEYPFTASGNLFTQSIIQNDELSLTVYNELTSLSPMTMSFLYTQSATYPDYNDSKFQAVIFPLSGSFTTRQRVWIGGGVGDTNYSYLAITGSGYYYFKLNDASGSMASISGSLTAVISASAVLNNSASLMIQLAASSSVQSNRNGVRFTLNNGNAVFYSTAISASVQKNNCSGGFTGSTVLVELTASYASGSSQGTANAIAQAYFNSISQSQANASGSCYSLNNARNLRLYNQMDNQITTDYPLTFSFYTTCCNTSSLPAQNDPGWQILGYVSSSQTSSITFWNYYLSNGYNQYQPASAVRSGSNADTGSYDLLKIRTATGDYLGLQNGGGTECTRWYNVNYPNVCPSWYALGAWIYNPPPYTVGSASVSIEIQPKIYNNFTQSLIKQNDFGFVFYNDANYPIWSSLSGSGMPLTASYILTSSATWPTVSDSDWKNIGYMRTGSGGFDGLAYRSYLITGSYIDKDIGTQEYGAYYGLTLSGSINTGSAYLYMKFVDKNGNLVTNIGTGSYMSSGSYNYISGSYQLSGSRIARIQGTILTSSMTNTISITFQRTF